VTAALPPADRSVLRDLARKVADVADLPVMAERRELWRRHTAMGPVRPVIYVDPQGAWCELIPDSTLVCDSETARGVETELRRRIYVAEHFASDNVIEREWIVRKAIRSSGWGLEPRRRRTEGDRAAFGFDPVIHVPADLAKLRFPEISHDIAATRAQLELHQELFGDILAVRSKGIFHHSYHLMNQYTALRGLEEVLVDMIENPGWVHEAMAFFAEGHRRMQMQYVDLGLLDLNNDNTPIYTSGYGYTDELPAPGFDPAAVRPVDLWGWAEAQEMAAASPDMHAEFVFPHEKRLLEPYGLTGYGCCDDVTHKLDFVLTLPRLRRVSVSPWADVDRCAERLRDKVIFMWKPHPAHLVGRFDPVALETYLRHTVEAAKANGCSLEIILLDTHSCENHPERFDEWTRVARRVVEEW
jgi:hypothetical protein